MSIDRHQITTPGDEWLTLRVLTKVGHVRQSGMRNRMTQRWKALVAAKPDKGATDPRNVEAYLLMIYHLPGEQQKLASLKSSDMVHPIVRRRRAVLTKGKAVRLWIARLYILGDRSAGFRGQGCDETVN